MKTFIKKSFIVFLFAATFMFLVGDLIHIGDNNNTYVNKQILYDLDYPQTQLNNHSLREVFENRNMAMPDLTGKDYLGNGVYRLYDTNLVLDYNIYDGIYTLNGTSLSSIEILLSIQHNFEPLTDYTVKIYEISGLKDISNVPYIRFRANTTNETTQPFTNTINGYTYTTTEQTNIFQLAGNATGVVATYTNWQFKLQLEKGSIATPYQIATNGPYNNIDIGTLNLSTQQINYWFEIYNTLKGLE